MMRTTLIVIGVLVVLVGLLFLFSDALFFLIFNGSTGTSQEAAAKFHAHRSDVRRITEIVRNDPALGWVTPGLKPKDMTQQNGPLTPKTVEDYEAVSALLSRGDFRDLAIVRDKTSSRALSFMRFVIFDPGRFGSPKPVLAEWAITPAKLEHSPGMSCAAVDDGWDVCPVDP